MQSELARVIDTVAREKNLDRRIIIDALEQAMIAAARRVLHKMNSRLEARYDEERGEVEIFEFKTVVEEVTDPDTQISLEEAQRIDPSAQVGDELGFKLPTDQFGRIAAQNARQVIMQKLREAERGLIEAEFAPKVGEIVTGIVRRVVDGDLIVELGRAEGILPKREQIPNEVFRPGDRVRALLLKVEPWGRGQIYC